MYKKKGNIVQDKQNLSNYIEGFDLYNSELITKLTDPSIKRIDYLITENEFRPDLIAKTIYGNESYTGILILTNSIGLESYGKGNSLSIIPKKVIDQILESL